PARSLERRTTRSASGCRRLEWYLRARRRAASALLQAELVPRRRGDVTASVVDEQARDAVLPEELEPVVEAGDEGRLREHLCDPRLGSDRRHRGEPARDRPARRRVDDVMRRRAV